mmetsp:Transcript_98/g.278  ORF Transcript_98/g.278 Transcript_98/m.278 type:complete len:112 (+) Transcript_98:530-865(+)
MALAVGCWRDRNGLALSPPPRRSPAAVSEGLRATATGDARGVLGGVLEEPRGRDEARRGVASSPLLKPPVLCAADRKGLLPPTPHLPGDQAPAGSALPGDGALGLRSRSWA